MNPKRSHNNVARVAGAILGLGIALAVLLASRPGAVDSPLPTTVRVAIAPVGELEVTPTPPDPIFFADSLLPGRPPTGREFQIRNQTGSDLAIGLTTTADSTALNGLLRLKLSANGRPLADTTLQGMRQRPVDLDLASGARSRLRLEAWIPKNVLGGYEGRLVRVSFIPNVGIPGGRR
jgi:hypothetical protein